MLGNFYNNAVTSHLMSPFQYLLNFVFLALMQTSLPTYIKAQTPFQEGVIIYKVEFIGKINQVDTTYETQKLTIYKKDSLLRIENSTVDNKEILGIQKTVEVRNQQGIFDIIPISSGFFGDSSKAFGDMMAEISRTPNFMSYKMENELRSESMKKGKFKPYVVDKILSKVERFGLSAERVLLSTSSGNDTTTAIMVRGFNILQSPAFNKYRSLPGTLLEFSSKKSSYTMRYTAISLKRQKLADSLFKVDSEKRK